MAFSDHKRVPALNVSSLAEYGRSIVTGFSSMQKIGQLTDFNIRLTSGRVIPVHKIFLNVASEHFRTMFSSRMREANDNEVWFKEFPDKAIQSVVDYIYGREISIEVEEVGEYLNLADFFRLHYLRTEIEKYMLNNIMIMNVVHWYFLADKYRIQAVKMKAIDILQNNFIEVCSKYDSPNLLEVFNILEKDSVAVNDTVKLKAVVQWTIRKEEERKHKFGDFMRFIDLEKCSDDYLAVVIGTYADRFLSQQCLESKFREAMSWNPVDRNNTNWSFFVFGGLDHQRVPSRSVSIIHLQKFRVTEMTQAIPQELLPFQAVRCMTLRGLFCADDVGKCVLYNPSSREITPFPQLLTKTSYPASASIGNKVYLMGGKRSQKTSVLCMDLKTKKCAPCESLRHGVEDAVSCRIDHYIYLLTCRFVDLLPGGIQLQRYDTEKDSWSVLKRPPSDVTDTKGVCAVAVRNKLYIIGGRDRLCLSYDYKEDIWYSHERPLKYHCNGGALCLGEMIVLCGGSASDVIEVFDLIDLTWHIVPLKLPHGTNFPVCMLN